MFVAHMSSGLAALSEASTVCPAALAMTEGGGVGMGGWAAQIPTSSWGSEVVVEGHVS